MIEIIRVNHNGTPYYEHSPSSIVWIMVAQIIHIRDCGDGLTEIIVRSHQHKENYYTVTPFDKIKSDIANTLGMK